MEHAPEEKSGSTQVDLVSSLRAQTYRLKNSTLAILDQDGRKIPMKIPTGSTVEIVEQDLNGNRLVDVNWEGKKVMMFTTDLRERAEAIHGTA